jgi:hypothetical protein
MLAHGVEVDQLRLAVAPEQVAGLEVAVADARGDELAQQRADGVELGGGGCRVRIGVAVGEACAGAVVADQPGLAAQRAGALLDQREGARRGDAEKIQAMPFQPGMPGAAGSPAARQRMDGPLML